MAMVLTNAVLDSVGKVDNLIVGRTDLQLKFSGEICCPHRTGCGCLRVHLCKADGDDSDGDGNGNGDGVGDGKHSTRST